jgi:Flp pilus assembly protein CpaB
VKKRVRSAGIRRTNPIRASRAAAILVGVAALAGAGYLTFTSGTEDVYVAAASLPAYHQITSADVRKRAVARRDVPQDAARDHATLLGRYTLTAMPADRSFQTTQLGPRLPDRAIPAAIVALPSTPETTLGGRLDRGDRVDILWSRNEMSDQPNPGKQVNDVLVVDVIDGPQAAVVAAIDPAIAGTIADMRGSSTVVVVRRNAYSGS